GLFGDVADAGELDLRGAEVGLAVLSLDLTAQEVEQVEHGLQRVVDLVRDGGSHAAGGGVLFGLDERGFDALAPRDIAEDLGGAEDGAALVLDGRDGEGDVEEGARLGAAD